MKMKGLGRGLDALLGGHDAPGKDEQRTLPLDQLAPGKYQPRTRMDADALQDLAASIKAQGIVQPILVRPIGFEKYEIIAGERRWRAAALAGLAEVPTLVREIADEAALAMSLIENIQREDLNPLEEAMGLQRLVDEFKLTHQQAADAIGRSRPAASNLMRLLQLAQPVQKLLMDGRLEMGHARALLPLPAATQIQLGEKIAQKNFTVREAERLANRALNPTIRTASNPDRDLLRLQEDLANILGAAVSIRANQKGRGNLTIDFASLDELDALIARLGGQLQS